MQIFLFLISQILLHRTDFNRYIVRDKTNYLCPVNKQRPLIMFLYIPVEQLTKSEVWTLHYAAVAATKTTNRPFQSGLVCSYAPIHCRIFGPRTTRNARAIPSLLPFVKNLPSNVSETFEYKIWTFSKYLFLFTLFKLNFSRTSFLLFKRDDNISNTKWKKRITFSKFLFDP